MTTWQGRIKGAIQPYDVCLLDQNKDADENRQLDPTLTLLGVAKRTDGDFQSETSYPTSRTMP